MVRGVFFALSEVDLSEDNEFPIAINCRKGDISWTQLTNTKKNTNLSMILLDVVKIHSKVWTN